MTSPTAGADGPDAAADGGGAILGGPGTRSRFELLFEAQDGAVTDALERINQELQGFGLGMDDRDTVRIVLAEVFNNIVEHAYAADAGGTIRACVEIGETGVVCAIRDTGRAMPAGPLPGETFPRVDPHDPEGLPEGGFGWAMLRHLTRNLEYRRQAGENVLCFAIP